MESGVPPELRSSAFTHKCRGAKDARASLEVMKSNVTTLAELASSLKGDLSEAKPNESAPTLA
jgi:hypothetical protein